MNQNRLEIRIYLFYLLLLISTYIMLPTTVEDEKEIAVEEIIVADTSDTFKIEPQSINSEQTDKVTSHIKKFRVTAYCACRKCCGQWSDGYTATMTKATQGRTIAVDPNVISLGSTVIINGYSYIAEDTGSAIKGDRIDIYFDNHQEAFEFGVQYLDCEVIGW